MGSRLIAAGAAGVLALAACGGDNADSEVGAALDHQVLRSSGDTFERPWTTITELVDFVVDNHDRDGFGGMRVVAGEFVDVEPGIGMTWEETADRDRMVVLKHGDPDAVVESVHFTFEIDEELAPHPSRNSSEIAVGVTFDAGFDFDQIEKDYLSLGRVVLFLEQSPVFAYQPGTYGILDNGLLVGFIDDAGRVDFPLVTDRNAFTPTELRVNDLRGG